MAVDLTRALAVSAEDFREAVFVEGTALRLAADSVHGQAVLAELPIEAVFAGAAALHAAAAPDVEDAETHSSSEKIRKN